MTTPNEIQIENTTWRIGSTPETEYNPTWHTERPVMVAIYTNPFHFQVHLTADQAREVATTMLEVLDQLDPK